MYCCREVTKLVLLILKLRGNWRWRSEGVQVMEVNQEDVTTVQISITDDQ